MKARAHLYISGKVQGVFYRAFTQEVADSLGLTGWVRNMPDRRVEAVFEGEKELIEKAVTRCHEGPPHANVKDMDVTWENIIEGLSDFRIRY
ncbi:MAG: acylphosphatase [Nitrospirae bacterium GWC2_46_6]|nr:MAG: acylphosphatase [Nitrospirae bacterium GWA2_46_11]OGW22333.1 MAG: acylphosphatase [Nitrospirae bacterium GWC2_46_6]OGW23163.1 MAG: acylphosphatase [Nitrospirae bacterium GWB2_47_37]HAK87712.1 acylphosphatase [Nitrospiraceae bacterium]HCZ12348.1 acylphosphatase [Nitrospiraceae bacterium]